MGNHNNNNNSSSPNLNHFSPSSHNNNSVQDPPKEASSKPQYSSPSQPPPSSPAAPSDQTAPGFFKLPATCSEQYLWWDQQVWCRCSKPLLEWCGVRRHLEDWLHHLRAARGQGVLQLHGDGAGLPGHSRQAE